MNNVHTYPQSNQSARSLLLDAFERLRNRYGPQNWWPGDSPFEVAIGAILTQSTNWRNVEKALQSLRNAGVLSPKGLLDVPEQDLARLIYSSGFFNSKAKKIKAFIYFLWQRFDGDIEAMRHEDADTLRKELLSVYGIGQETADDILLYVAQIPSFVVDAYTRRIVDRLGISPRTKSYESYRSLFQNNLPADETLFNEYHALLVQLGKEVCRRKPLCAKCCLLAICPTGQAFSSSLSHE